VPDSVLSSFFEQLNKTPAIFLRWSNLKHWLTDCGNDIHVYNSLVIIEAVEKKGTAIELYKKIIQNYIVHVSEVNSIGWTIYQLQENLQSFLVDSRLKGATVIQTLRKGWSDTPPRSNTHFTVLNKDAEQFMFLFDHYLDALDDANRIYIQMARKIISTALKDAPEELVFPFAVEDPRLSESMISFLRGYKTRAIFSKWKFSNSPSIVDTHNEMLSQVGIYL
jgi:hypothetical protein